MTPTPGTLTLAEVRKRHIAVNAEAARSLWVDIYGEDAHDDRAFLIEKLDAAVKALKFYGTACGAAESTEQVARGDVDMSRVDLAFNEDCGDIARTALKEIGAE